MEQESESDEGRRVGAYVEHIPLRDGKPGKREGPVLPFPAYSGLFDTESHCVALAVLEIALTYGDPAFSFSQVLKLKVFTITTLASPVFIRIHFQELTRGPTEATLIPFPDDTLQLNGFSFVLLPKGPTTS